MRDNLIFVGTSHISKESVDQVKTTIEKEKPKIVALELDPKRMIALQDKRKRKSNKFYLLRKLGLFGFLFYIFGEFVQGKLGKIVNVSPGSEMIAALKMAKENKCDVVLIDRDIEITLSRFSKFFGMKGLFRIFFDIIKGMFRKTELEKFDLSKVPEEELIEKVMEMTKERYPAIYNVLVKERDIIMANNLFFLSEKYPEEKIVVVIGAGHLKGIKENLAHLADIKKENN